MLPTVELGTFRFNAYAFFAVFAFSSAYVLIRRKLMAETIPPNVLDTMVPGVILSAVFGSHIFYMAWFDFSGLRHFYNWIAIWDGGFVVQGGFTVALLYVYVHLRVHKIQFFSFADVAAPYVAFGLGLGRLACFAVGCCYGSATSLPWAASYPIGTPCYELYNSLGVVSGDRSPFVHPVQIYEMLSLSLLAMVLLAIRHCRQRTQRGAITSLFFIGYGLSRFILQYFRQDPYVMIEIFPLFDMAQVTALLYVFVGFSLCVLPVRPRLRKSKSGLVQQVL